MKKKAQNLLNCCLVKYSGQNQKMIFTSNLILIKKNVCLYNWASGFCLKFAKILSILSLVLLIKVLLIKKSVYLYALFYGALSWPSLHKNRPVEEEGRRRLDPQSRGESVFFSPNELPWPIETSYLSRAEKSLWKLMRRSELLKILMREIFSHMPMIQEILSLYGKYFNEKEKKIILCPLMNIWCGGK